MALLLVAVCVLAWRLAQGPIDLTALMPREQTFVAIPGARLTLGGADLAWEGFSAGDQPLIVRLRDVALSLPNGGPALHVAQARVRFAESQLLLGRFAPRAASLAGVEVSMRRNEDGSVKLGLPAGPGQQSPSFWPSQLSQFSVQSGTVIVHDAKLGIDWRAADVALAGSHVAGTGLYGQGRATLQAGGVQSLLSFQAVPAGDTTQVTAALTPVNPASLARLSAQLGALARIDAPVTADLTAVLDPDMRPVEGALNLVAGPGSVRAGQGAMRLASATALLAARQSELRLDHLRLALAPLRARATAPVVTGIVVTGTGKATRADGHVRCAFDVDIDVLPMADLSEYWPAGTGAGARAWLIQNITAGTARQAHLAAQLESSPDLSDVTVKALSGGLTLNDATVWWLRPVPPIVHANARVAIEGPDAVHITVQGGEQDRLTLLPGSRIRITGLQARDQFADIAASLSGPVTDALILLDHPRLRLLSRGGVKIVEPAGAVRAQLTMHVPLDDRVTMDDITVGATAQLTGIHLGRVVAGRDLDEADLSAKVTGTGLTIAGNGAVAGIPAKLSLDMDFRNGPPNQVLQHLAAEGAATPEQLLAAGLPAAAVHVLTGGSAGLHVDYTSRRSAAAVLQVDADLGQASVATPFGWSKPAGAGATAGGRVTLDHGRLSGVDDLHAEGPGLAIVSHAVVSPRVRILQFQRLDLGRTSAHGQIGFPVKADAPINVALSGPSLDLSAYFASSDKPVDRPNAPDDKPGLPWTAKLDFAKLFLAHDTTLAPLHVNAASDGRRILHAMVSAGANFTASVTPGPGKRQLSVSSADAGATLTGLGVAGLSGGTLRLDGSYDDSLSGYPLTGTATLDNFNVRDAPTIGRLLQVMTLYGVADTLHGPGLHFSHLIAAVRMAASGAPSIQRARVLPIFGRHRQWRYRSVEADRRHTWHGRAGLFLQSASGRSAADRPRFLARERRWRFCRPLLGPRPVCRPQGGCQSSLCADAGILAQRVRRVRPPASGRSRPVEVPGKWQVMLERRFQRGAHLGHLLFREHPFDRAELGQLSRTLRLVHLKLAAWIPVGEHVLGFRGEPVRDQLSRQIDVLDPVQRRRHVLEQRVVGRRPVRHAHDRRHRQPDRVAGFCHGTQGGQPRRHAGRAALVTLGR